MRQRDFKYGIIGEMRNDRRRKLEVVENIQWEGSSKYPLSHTYVTFSANLSLS